MKGTWSSTETCKDFSSIILPWFNLAIALCIHSYFDNVLTKFMINNRTDTWKTDITLLLWQQNILLQNLSNSQPICLAPDNFKKKPLLWQWLKEIHGECYWELFWDYNSKLTFKTVTDFFRRRIKNFFQFRRDTNEQEIALLDTFQCVAELVFCYLNKL